MGLYAPFFICIPKSEGLPVEFNKSNWRPILLEAVKQSCEQTQAAVPGAKLRALVGRLAQAQNLTYPPAEAPKIRFREFVEAFGDLVVVRTRPSQDFLVAPVDRPELLISRDTAPGRPLPGIRRDLFEAFVHVNSDVTPWYEAELDQVHFIPKDSVPAKGWIRIPAADIEQARKDRRDFASQIDDPALRQSLEALLGGNDFMPAFTAEVHRAGRQAEWHIYRSKLILQRIKEWTSKSKIEWKEEWITSSPSGRHEPLDEKSGTADRQSMFQVLQQLDADELSRIQLPLDLVAKLLSGRR